MRANEHIRKAMKEKGVAVWQVAAVLCVSEMTVFRLLRFPLPPEKEAQIMEALETAEKEG